MLNVWRTRIWKLMNDGVGAAEHGKPGGSEKLVSRDHVEARLLEESCKARRMMRDASRPNSEGDVGSASRPWPRSIGMISDGTLPSSESEGFVRQQLRLLKD